MNLPVWLRKLLPVLALILLTAAISTPIYAARILEPTTSDYDAHIVWTLRMLRRELPPTDIIARPALQLAIGFFYWAGRGRLGLWESAVLVQVLAQIAAALILYAWIGPIRRKWGEVLRVFLAISLTVVAPVMLLAFIDHKFYFGYIALANYHNPTVHLLRPFALATFFFSLRSFKIPRSPLWMVLLAAACAIGGMMTKPNYAIALLPALGLAALWFIWKKRPIDWRMLLGGVVVPLTAMLVFQFVMVYMLPDAGPTRIEVAPFAVESYWSGYLPLKFLLSILFPLAVLALNWKQVRQDDEMILVWITFLIAVVQMYLFAETGDRFRDANFRWGAQVALLILFASSVRFMLQRAAQETTAPQKRWPAAIVYAMYALHIAGGIAYYIYCFVQVGYA